MQFTLTTDYAMRVVYYLATEKEMRNTEMLSSNLGIPASYVPKVTKSLKKAGIIDAIEGTQGGYRLSKPSSEISLLDILNCTEKTIKLNRCLEDACECSRFAVSTCPIRKIYQSLQHEFEGRFGDIAIGDLIGKQKKQQNVYLLNIIINLQKNSYFCEYVHDSDIGAVIPQAGQYSEFVNSYISRFVHESEQDHVRAFMEEKIDSSTENAPYQQEKIRYRRKTLDGHAWMEMTRFYEQSQGYPTLLLTIHNTSGTQKELEYLGKSVQQTKQELKSSYWELIEAFRFVVQSLSPESKGHSQNVSHYTEELLHELIELYPETLLTEEEINAISHLAALHDIGKLTIPHRILEKPGTLTKQEISSIRHHTENGAELARKIPTLTDNPEWAMLVYNICRFHHERYDGAGYPDGLKGEEIPLCAQVVGIVDCYDALTNERVYNPVYSHETAVKMILHGECGAFSERIKTSFVAATKRETWKTSDERGVAPAADV